jgi:quercetin dioxygenase-like cupin family protein
MPESNSYFEAPTGTPTEAGRFVEIGELPAVFPVPGLTLRPLLGTGQMVSFVRYERDAEAPLHAHVEEQIFITVEGEFEVQVGDEVQTLLPGQAAVIPSWVPHRVIARNGPGYQIDVFCPPRRGLLDMLAASS